MYKIFVFRVNIWVINTRFVFIMLSWLNFIFRFKFLFYLSLIGSIDQSVLKELPPELLAEIESTMPLCERVKMNKRKRSTVNEKPKYAEISSDEDNDSDEAFECKYHLTFFRN